MAAKEITELLQTGGAAGDSALSMDDNGALVRRDSVPYDKDAAAVDSSGDDLFIGVSVSGEARTFNAIPYTKGAAAVDSSGTDLIIGLSETGDARTFNAVPYIKGDAAATPNTDDLVVGVGSDGSAKQFTIASLATTLEGASFGSAAFVNHGTAAGEVPLNSDLGELAYKDSASVAEAEAGVTDKYPDAAGVLASINANSFSGTSLELIWSGSSSSVNLSGLPNGYPGDGQYVINVDGQFTSIWFVSGENSRQMYMALPGVTLSVKWLLKTFDEYLQARTTEYDGSIATTSSNTITEIYKIV